MSADPTVRPLIESDLPAVGAVLDATGLFPSDMLADMVAPFLSGAAQDRWLVVEIGKRVAGFLFCEPERMTDGTFNLLAMAVDPALQGQGLGRALVDGIEAALAADGARVLLVETSGLPDYAATRAFYAARGFTHEATIRDFYAAGEDKIVYWKALGG